MMSAVPEISNTVHSDSNQRHTVTKHRSPSEPAHERGAHHGVVQARIGKRSSLKEAPRPFYQGVSAFIWASFLFSLFYPPELPISNLPLFFIFHDPDTSSLHTSLHIFFLRAFPDLLPPLLAGACLHLHTSQPGLGWPVTIFFPSPFVSTNWQGYSFHCYLSLRTETDLSSQTFHLNGGEKSS